MTDFSVWAPDAERVRLRLAGDTDHEMRAAADGWWRVEVPDAGPDYSFLLNDDETPRGRDPASLLPDEIAKANRELVELVEERLPERFGLLVLDISGTSRRASRPGTWSMRRPSFMTMTRQTRRAYIGGTRGFDVGLPPGTRPGRSGASSWRN